MARFFVPHSREGGFSKPWNKFFFDIARKIGADKIYSLGGTLTTNTTAVGNVGSGADTLISYSLPKNTLSNDGDVLEIVAYGTQASNANNKTIKLVFGTTELFTTGAVASNGKDWEIRCTITRTAAATQNCSTVFLGDTVLVTQMTDFTAATEDFTTALTIKCTGEATSNDDIIQKGLFIKLFPTT
jgi:hypothetical protein